MGGISLEKHFCFTRNLISLYTSEILYILFIRTTNFKLPFILFLIFFDYFLKSSSIVLSFHLQIVATHNSKKWYFIYSQKVVFKAFRTLETSYFKPIKIFIFFEMTRSCKKNAYYFSFCVFELIKLVSF